MSAEHLYDVWCMPEGRWLGMVMGDTPAEAREILTATVDRDPGTMLLLPYQPLGTAEATFIALVGREPRAPVNHHAQCMARASAKQTHHLHQQSLVHTL